MKKFAFLAALATTLFGCSNKNIETVDVNKFESLINAGKVQLLDARTAEEYNEEAIPGAMNIDVKQDDFLEKSEKQLSKDKPVAIYCRSGKRSMMGAQQLSQAKFKVFNLDGGILAWKDAGKKTKK